MCSTQFGTSTEHPWAKHVYLYIHKFPGDTSGKEPVCQCRRHKRRGFNPWVEKIPWKRKWQPTPVFLLGISQGQRSLAGYSPWDCKESGMTEHACMHISININIALDRLWSECLSEYNLIFPLSLPFFFCQYYLLLTICQTL